MTGSPIEGVKSVVNKKVLHKSLRNQRDLFRILDGLNFEFMKAHYGGNANEFSRVGSRCYWTRTSPLPIK